MGGVVGHRTATGFAHITPWFYTWGEMWGLVRIKKVRRDILCGNRSVLKMIYCDIFANRRLEQEPANHGNPRQALVPVIARLTTLAMR